MTSAGVWCPHTPHSSGLSKHAAAVERHWFQPCLARLPHEQIGGNSFGEGEIWQVGSEETIADVIAEHAMACDRSRQIEAGFVLDDRVTHPRLGRSLRYIYVHLIRELARRCGHAVGDLTQPAHKHTTHGH